MKRTFNLAVLIVLMLAMLPAGAMAATQSDPFVTALIAGQHTDVGDVKIWDDSQNLYVKFETTSPYCLVETQLHVGSTLDEIPQKNGNPAPGQFDYKKTHKCKTSVLYTVPLPAAPSCKLYVAAHAVINNGETAWGAGPEFPGKNWATYSVYKPESCNVNPPPECEPRVVSADFSKIAVGDSIEGMGILAPNLSIDAKGTAIKVRSGQLPDMYKAPNGDGTINGELAPGGGFSDEATREAKQAHRYTFSFAPGTSVTYFSLHMLDYGDLNTSKSSNHYVSFTAYDAGDQVVDMQELSYTTPPVLNPMSSDLYGDLYVNGDATAAPGLPGNWTWNVSGNGIVKVVLEFGEGYDPHIAFDRLRFVTGCPACSSLAVNGDFSQIPVGDSIEGMGVLAPYLDVNAKGTAIKVDLGLQPNMYKAPNVDGTINGGLAAGGGFSDEVSREAKQAHLYTFAFAPGTTVSSFSVRMLDYGDLNTSMSAFHYVSMKAYDANNNVVAIQELSYNTPPVLNPMSSDSYGDLYINGDAAAAPGYPGNWTWNVSGTGIVKVVLEFGAGFDPHIAFDGLSYTIECLPE